MRRPFERGRRGHPDSGSLNQQASASQYSVAKERTRAAGHAVYFYWVGMRRFELVILLRRVVPVGSFGQIVK